MPSPLPELEERLEAIAANAQAPEESFEPALKAILEATGARAGALCLFDQRQGVLRLSAEVGLSDEGCKQLRQVRRGDPRSWDMPLHGLLNRRAYLIESAPQNRYVPRLVEASALVRTVACVPIYGGFVPLGNLILVALAPRSFTERDIHALERPLRRVGKMIEAVRRLGGGEVLVTPSPALGVTRLIAERDRLRDEVVTRDSEIDRLRVALEFSEGERLRLGRELQRVEHEAEQAVPLEAAERERARLAAELEQSERQAERATALAAALATAERERARLTAALEAAAEERAGLVRARGSLEGALAGAESAARNKVAEAESRRATLATEAAEATARAREADAEVGRLNARLVELETAVAHERGLARERDREQQRLLGELRAAAERDRKLREDLRATTADALSADNGRVRDAVEAARVAEEVRTSAVAEAAAARAAQLSAQASAEALGEEVRQARVEIERLVSTERAARERVERVREQEFLERTRREELERDLRALREEHDRLRATEREREAEAAVQSVRSETVLGERDRLRETLASVEAERDRLAAESEARGPAAHQAGERSRLEQALSRETAERSRLEEALAREATERARLSKALGEIEASLAATEAERARAEAEAESRAIEIERLEGERDRLLAERDSAPAESAPAADAAPPARDRVRVVTVAMASARARRREARADQPVVVVLDVDTSWEEVTLDGHGVVVVAPGEDAAVRLQDITPVRTVANLAAPGVLEALGSLRAAGSTTRFWGCVAARGRDETLALGMIEPTSGPVDPDSLLGALGAYAGRGTRVVTAGGDVDVLMSLRQALARRGLSVSMAWDAKQAADLLGVVRPELVVVDLALPRREGYRITCGLAAIDPVPHLVLIPGEEEGAAAFAAILEEPVRGRELLRRHSLLARFVARSEAPPEDRQAKVRAIGRK